MHYAEFAEDEVRLFALAQNPSIFLLMLMQSQALLNAIKEYETNKWKVIGAKVGKPAKVGNVQITEFIPIDQLQACEQYAKEHFGKT